MNTKKYPLSITRANARHLGKPQITECRTAEDRRSDSPRLHRKNLLIVFLILLSLSTAPAAESKWSGVDESVVEKFAEAAGRPARDPFINTDQGDILLFVFLLAGTIGGFIAGYYFRMLFPPRSKPEKELTSV